MDELQLLKEGLASSRVAERKKAAKAVGKKWVRDAGEALWEAYLAQLKIPNSWEAQIEMIHSLGLIKYEPARDAFLEICRRNEAHDMITCYAAMAFVRIDRKTADDVGPVFMLFEFGGFSVVDGALRALAADKTVPGDNEIEKIIRFVEAIPLENDPGYSDIREGLACACAGWKKELAADFLKMCRQSPDTALVKVATNALKGKYSDINLI